LRSSPYIALLLVAWRYARQQRSQYVLIYVLFGLANLVLAAYPILYGWFINQLQQRKSDVLSLAVTYGAIYVLLKLTEWSLHGPARIMERKLAFDLSRNFLQERYHQALHLPVKWHQDHHSGSTINRLRKAYEALRSFFDGGFMYIHALSKFLFSFVAMVYFSPLFGTIGVLLGLLTVWVIFKFDKPLIESQKDVNEKEHVISATLFDSLSNIITVVTLRLEKSMEPGLMSKVADVLPSFRRNAVINEWKWFSADMLVGLTYAVITVGFVYQNWVPGQIFLVGGLVTLLGYVNQFTSVFHDVAWQYTQIIQYHTDVSTASEIESAFKAEHRPDEAKELPNSWRRIDISGLCYSHQQAYSSQSLHSLHDIQLSIEPSKKIALIGKSGSGKSTLLAILRGLYQPEATLVVTVDGQKTDLTSVNETTTLFPQEPEIFENTILYNVTLGLPFAEEEVASVCRIAQFDEVSAQLPKGMESNIQEKGVNLSGGQKQRLALARGILAARDSELVLLDEPTSSVDPKTEAAIYQQMFEQFSEKAIVSSLHRLHLLKHFDEICVMEQGRIVARGTFDRLLDSSKEFQELWRHQETRPVI
jgi:ATP-binding cassette, subfamily B, bacterial